MTQQVIKMKDLRRQTKEWMAVFLANCVRNIIEKAVSICVIIPQNRKVKKFQLHIIDQSFEYNSLGISYRKKFKSLEEKKAVHTSCKHGVRGICQLYTKGEPPANSREVNLLEIICIIVDETTDKDPAPKHWTSLDSDYASRGRM